MHELAQSLKALLNRLATRAFARLGYSDPMIRHAKREGWWWIQARAHALSGGTGLIAGRAVVFTGPGIVELLPVEIPAARSGEVTVAVATSVVSPGTERAYYLQLPNTGRTYPFQPGYSAAGVVLATGSGEAAVERGDLVAVRNVGHSSVATAPAHAVYPVPDGVPLEAAALVQVGVICGQGVRRAAIETGESVVVVGAGLIGAMAARLVTAEEGGPVSVIAKSHVKESSAMRSGAARFLSSEEDTEEIAALESPVVIEATGDPGALAVAVAAAGDRGRIVLLGSPRGVTTDVPASAIRAKRLRVIGAHVDTLGAESRQAGEDLLAREALTFLDHLAAGRLQVADLLEEVVDPREAGSFYRRLARERGLVGARFDWTVLSAHERMADGNLFRLPALSARGIDMNRRPLAARSGASRSPHRNRTAPDTATTLRIGLLGCGDIAVLNAAAIGASPNTRLVACFDPIEALAQDIASQHGATVCATSDALLARADVDAVLLSVPHHLHEPLGAEAASAGKHVIVEKPLANELDAARALVDAAERGGVSLSVCFPHRYHPNVEAARRLISEGAVGAVTGTFLSFLADKPPSYWGGGYSGRAQTSWRRSREDAGGGVLIMNLSHYIDLVRHLTGLEVDLVAAQLQAEEPTSEVEDAVSLTVRYANGAIGSVLGAAAVRGADAKARAELRLWGSDGHLAIEPKPLVYSLRAIPGLPTGRWQSFASAGSSNIRTEYFSRLATAIGAGKPPEITGLDGLAVQAFIEAAYRSAATGKSISPRSLVEDQA